MKCYFATAWRWYGNRPASYRAVAIITAMRWLPILLLASLLPIGTDVVWNGKYVVGKRSRSLELGCPFAFYKTIQNPLDPPDSPLAGAYLCDSVTEFSWLGVGCNILFWSVVAAWIGREQAKSWYAMDRAADDRASSGLADETVTAILTKGLFAMVVSVLYIAALAGAICGLCALLAPAFQRVS